MKQKFHTGEILVSQARNFCFTRGNFWNLPLVFFNSKNNLIPGLFAHIKIEGLVYKNAISIPQTALLQDAAGTFVYIVKDNQAVKVLVKIGNIVKDTYVIESGLNSGDMVITNNLTKLKPGSSIELMSKE